MAVSWPRGTLSAMDDSHNPRRAAVLRDHAALRVRRITALSLAGATALTGVFAAMAAASTHTAKRVVKATAPKAHPAATKPTPGPVTAPVPALVENGSSAAAPPSSSSSSGAPVVTQSSAPPVVVSGGS
jgi:hypothetical protein